MSLNPRRNIFQSSIFYQINNTRIIIHPERLTLGRLTIGALILCLAMTSSGCLDRVGSSYRGIDEVAGRRETESTEKTVAASNELQTLEKLCRDIPIIREVEPEIKSISKNNDELFFYYQLEQKPEEVFGLAKRYLAENGWLLKKENNGFWEHQIEFIKGEYWVQITTGDFGNANFATNCLDKRLSK